MVIIDESMAPRDINLDALTVVIVIYGISLGRNTISPMITDPVDYWYI
jgi:hypothetical protein